MAAPTPTTRLAPVGSRLKSGHKTLITIAADTNISFWEITVKPPSIEMEDFIDITTMHNDEWIQMAPPGGPLKTLGETTLTVGYDPDVLTQIEDIIGVETTITVTLPNRSTYAFFGVVKSFDPQENSRGEMPTAEVTIVPTNTDPSDGSEAGPTYSDSTGTFP